MKDPCDGIGPTPLIPDNIPTSNLLTSINIKSLMPRKVTYSQGLGRDWDIGAITLSATVGFSQLLMEPGTVLGSLTSMFDYEDFVFSTCY